MTDKIQTSLRDSAAVRRAALLLLSLAMFCAYTFADILFPIKELMQRQRGWDSTTLGTMQGSEIFLNVSVFFLIFTGIILDRMGVRLTAILSGAAMLASALIKYYAVSDSFAGSALDVRFTNNLNHIPIFEQLDVSPFYQGMPASIEVAVYSLMISGYGIEMAGTIASRGTVEWFEGREVAPATSSEAASARPGVVTRMIFSPFSAKLSGDINVSRSVTFGIILICIALMMLIVHFLIDKKLDSQTGEAEEKDDPFKINDPGKILSGMGFRFVALLCVLHYSAIFPFQKYAVNVLQCNPTFHGLLVGSFQASSGVTIIQYVIMLVVTTTAFMLNFVKNKTLKNFMLFLFVLGLVVYCYMDYVRQSAEPIFAVSPLFAVGITPVLGSYVDHKSKAASMLVPGSLFLIARHLTFAFILPQFKSSQVGGVVIAYVTTLTLGTSFSLVPASLWPSVPKLIDAKTIGSAYVLIFWIQDIGLWLSSLLIDKVLDKTNIGVTDPTQLNYTALLIMLAGLDVIALTIGLTLKVVGREHNLGLEEPDIKEQQLYDSGQKPIY